jgi:hypothetical protein
MRSKFSGRQIGRRFCAVYYTESTASMHARNALHKQIGEILAEAF